MEPPPPDWPLLQAAQRDAHAAHRRLLARVGAPSRRRWCAAISPGGCGAAAAALLQPGSAGMTRRPAPRHRRRHDRPQGRARRRGWHDAGAGGQEYPTQLPAPQLGGAGSRSVVARVLLRSCRGCSSAAARRATTSRASASAGRAGRGRRWTRTATPLRPAIIWLDRRSDAQCAWLHEHGRRGGDHPESTARGSIRSTSRPSGCG